ncbi:MAG: NAD(P)/FAD-dependent oxidoreductase [Acholeplasmatales bacterium]|nr:NAD(P)/FAD-dependent oxidoreductase [Acholeplasmatales bacterium]
MFDCIIIGCGITGASIAYELSKYKMKVCILEALNDIGDATTKANSGIVHAGYDPLPNTLMAKLNVIGSSMYESLAKKLNVHYEKIGSLVVGKKEDEGKILELYDRGVQNGCKDLSIIYKKDIEKLEPNINPEIEIALYAKNAAIVSPFEMCYALAKNAVSNGVELHLNSKVIAITKKDDKFIVKTEKDEYETKYVINAAGIYADNIYNMVLGDNQRSFKIVPVKGSYYLLDKSEGKLVNHILFQTPSEKGKGVLATKTVHGNLIVGPDAIDSDSKDDVSVSSDSLEYIREKISFTTNKINYKNNVRNFSGLRAKVMGFDDFIIGNSIVSGFINFAGIKSPGLSAAPAFGPCAKDIIESLGFKFERKDDYKDYPINKFFRDYTKEELNEKIKENPLYGRIICRCESVSEGEIVDAINDIIPALSIDAVKRRCNSGMGRCQGGFCQPKVLEIIARELHISPKEVLQDNLGSNIVLDYTKEGI